MSFGRHARARGARLHRRTAAAVCAALVAASAGVLAVEPSGAAASPGIASSPGTVASAPSAAPSSVRPTPDSHTADDPVLADTGSRLDVTVTVGLALLLGGSGLVLLAARTGRRR